MKILIASDSFKDCLSAKKVGESLEKGFRIASSDFKIRIVPVADGGEGTVESLVDATNGSVRECSVKDALLRTRKAFYGILGDNKTAVIEMAAASGIEHLDLHERNPWITSTYGTGELIKDALDQNCERIVIGIGGSATNDGGTGMAKALGVKFLDTYGSELAQGGGSLSELAFIDNSELDSRISKTEIIVACDVDNPLTGIHGASYVYGPQKGANSDMVKKLDANLGHLSSKIKEFYKKDIETIPGAGAAGGLGAGLMAFCCGRLEKGFSIVSQETDLVRHCKWADVVITGEGKMDFQTKFGKTPYGVASIAKQFKKPVIAIAGTLGEDYTELYQHGFNAIYSIVDRPMKLEEALSNASELIKNTGVVIGNLLKIKGVVQKVI
jgi:glycerate kinase